MASYMNHVHPVIIAAEMVMGNQLALQLDPPAKWGPPPHSREPLFLELVRHLKPQSEQR